MAFVLREILGCVGCDVPVVKGSSVDAQSSSSYPQSSQICGVWGNSGRFFVSTDGGSSLWVTDLSRRSRWTKCDVFQEDPCSVKHVISNPSKTSQVYVVYSNSRADCLELNTSTGKWIKKHTFQLSNAKGAQVLSAALHPDTNMFFWCEQRASALRLSSCCVCMREVQEQYTDTATLYVGPVVAILHSCPATDLYMLHKGICAIPTIPVEQPRMLLFWTFVPRKLKAFIWDHGTIGDLDKSDFKGIMLDVLPAWNSVHNMPDGNLVSVTSNPNTLEMLLIDNQLSVSCAVLVNGHPVIKPLCVLTPTGESSHVSGSFAISVYIGLVWASGLVTVYDVGSGVVLCSIDNLTGTEPQAWLSCGVVNRVGLWSPDGVWLLESRSVVDVAAIIQTSPHAHGKVHHAGQSTPLSTHVDHDAKCAHYSEGNDEDLLFKEDVVKLEIRENHCSSCSSDAVSEHQQGNGGDTTYCVWKGRCCCSQDTYSKFGLIDCSSCRHCVLRTHFLSHVNFSSIKDNSVDPFSRYAAAITFLQTWNLDNYAAKLALNAAILSEVMGECSVVQELLISLCSKSFQNPALALAFLKNSPVHRTKVFAELQQFITCIEDSNSENETIKTPLNKTLLPELRHFHVLIEEFEDLFAGQDSASNVRTDACSWSAIDSSELVKGIDLGYPDQSALCQLSLLAGHSHMDIMTSMVDLFGLNEREGAVMSSKQGQRMRKLFRIEWKDGQWRKRRHEHGDQHSAFLSLLCHVAYDLKPDLLVTLKGRGLAAVSSHGDEEHVKSFVTQSILESLPILKVEPSPPATSVHANLLWAAGQELQALQILLGHRMWTQSLQFYCACGRNSQSAVVLYVMLLKALLRSGVTTDILHHALELAPVKLSTYEILAIFKETERNCHEPFMHNHTFPTIGELRAHLEKFLKM